MMPGCIIGVSTFSLLLEAGYLPCPALDRSSSRHDGQQEPGMLSLEIYLAYGRVTPDKLPVLSIWDYVWSHPAWSNVAGKPVVKVMVLCS